MRIQAPRGTKDVLPAESHRWVAMESAFRDVARLFGYSEIRTPTFEDTALFTRTVGETTDIVTKEMYTFMDKGDRSMTLKPEGTAPAIRAVVEHSLLQAGTPLRLSYITPFFRYERPQQGRLREPHQMGLELIGSSSPAADAEIIEATVAFFRKLGLAEVVVRMNSLGAAACRTAYRDALLSHAQPYLQTQEEVTRERMSKNPLRLLDTKDPAGIEAMKGAPSILNYLSPESAARFTEVQRLLGRAKVEFEIDPGIVRGLDYYSHTVFEIHTTKLGAQAQLCGGGRYDGLLRELGGQDLGCIGVGIGMERVLLVLEQEGGASAQPGPDVAIILASPEASDALAELATELRLRGVSVVIDVDGKNVKAQFKHADRVGSPLAVILGEDELARGEVTIKKLFDGTQESVPLAQAPDLLAHRVGAVI
jgi:histidyl-tRNA synthetase